MPAPTVPGSRTEKPNDTQIGIYILKLEARGNDCSNRLTELGKLFNK